MSNNICTNVYSSITYLLILLIRIIIILKFLLRILLAYFAALSTTGDSSPHNHRWSMIWGQVMRLNPVIH